MNKPPEWFGKAIAHATAEDIFNALSLERKDEVEAAITNTGQPPEWFLASLKEAGLSFRNPTIPAKS